MILTVDGYAGDELTTLDHANQIMHEFNLFGDKARNRIIEHLEDAEQRGLNSYDPLFHGTAD